MYKRQTIAVAVTDPVSGEFASACITYPAAIVTPAERARIASLLTDGARRVGADLGDPVWLAAPRRRRIA